MSSVELVPPAIPPATLKRLNSDAGRVGAQAWVAWTAAKQQIHALGEIRWPTEWVGYASERRGQSLRQKEQRLETDNAGALATLLAKQPAMEVLLSHPDDRVVAHAIRQWMPASYLFASIFVESAEEEHGPGGQILAVMAPSGHRFLEQLLDQINARLTPLRDPAQGTPWSPILDALLDDRTLTVLLERRHQGRPLRLSKAEAEAHRPLDAFGGGVRVARLLEDAGSLEQAMTVVPSQAGRRMLILHTPRVDGGLVAQVLAQKIMDPEELAAHPGLTSDGVRLLIQDAILALAQGWTGRFTKFLAAFYQAGRQLEVPDLLQLKVLYLQGPRVNGRAMALAGVRELVADPELGEPLVKAMSATQFANHLRGLSPDIWGAAFGEEMQRQTRSGRTPDFAKVLAAIEVAHPTQLAAITRATLRQLLVSSDPDVRVLGAQLMGKRQDGVMSLDQAEPLQLAEPPSVALPSLKVKKRGSPR